MRSEQDMMRLIIEVAQNNPSILAVGMNGSRTNTRVPKDVFQDYDIVYIVEDVFKFIEDSNWIDVFGPRLIMQTPEAMSLFPVENDGRFAYLMLFEDGNRIDLSLCPKEQADNWHQGDLLAKILLDKQTILPKLEKATDKNYWIKEPSQQEFSDCCNQFWWVNTYVAKGLCRKELFYAKDHLGEYCQQELFRLLTWTIGRKEGYTFSIGKNYKYLPDYLDKQVYEKILKTMDYSSYASCWRGLLIMQDLFEELAFGFAKKNRFYYDEKMVENIKVYTKKLKKNFE